MPAYLRLVVALGTAVDMSVTIVAMPSVLCGAAR